MIFDQARESKSISLGACMAVVVKRDWVNPHGVKMFLRQPENVQAAVRLDPAGASNDWRFDRNPG